MALSKKSETFTLKPVSELVVGDRFRIPDKPPLQKVMLLDIAETDEYDVATGVKKQIVSCTTNVEGSIEEFRFTAFNDVEVEVLDA